ncbi:MAG: response regulator [Paludibacteraceae bacterium]|nr:response regulator [Paludibacteraceae bacterium]
MNRLCRHMARLLLLLLPLSAAGQLPNTADRLTVTHYGVENGLSQNTVMSILQDRQGYMWFGTWDGLNRLDGYTFTVFKARQDAPNTAVNNRVDAIYEDDSQQLWWRTYDDRFYRLDSERQTVTSVSGDSLPADVQTALAPREDSIAIDHNGIVWRVDDRPGIARCRDGQWRRLQPVLDSRYEGQLRRNFLLLEDRQGRVWVNPTGGGFGYYDPERDELVSPFFGRVSNMIHTAYIDHNGRLWLSTYDKGVDCIDMTPRPYCLHDMREPGVSGEVRALCQTADGRLIVERRDNRRIYSLLPTADGLLIGTKGHGVLRQGAPAAPDAYPLNCPDVYDMLQDSAGMLYVATYGGGINVLRPEGRAMRPQAVIGSGRNVRAILLDGHTLWAATTSGLLRADLRTGREDFADYGDVRCLCLTDTTLWVGSFGSGLARVNTCRTDSLVITPVPTNADILLSMTTDGEQLWYTSETGITCLNPSDLTYRYFSALESDPGAYFTEAKALCAADGTLYFAYSNGYCKMSPRRVTSLDEVPPLYITRCYADGQAQPVGPMTLDYDQSTFAVDFAALEFTAPDRIQYACMLEGVDNDWHYVDGQRHIIYANLRHGTYTFRVRSTNREGLWVDNECSLTVHVRRNPWFSPLAILFYLLLLAGAVYIAFRLLRSYEQLHQELEVEQKVTDIKLRFFTNISHELRTPLTLISGPVENILQTEKITPAVRDQLEIVRSNSNRMLRMVNQLLDFRKIQNRKMRLRIRRTLLSDLVSETAANFNKEAYDKHITFHVENHAQKGVVWVDRERVDTILYNLLSNAFKFTPAGKSITVRIDEKPDFVLLSVQDEGVGIPHEKRSVLFERFSSHNEVRNDSATPGTGIGLNLVKELVDLHHGYIEVESVVGQGTTFTVMFKTGKEHFGNEADIIVDDQTGSASLTGNSPIAELEEQTAERKSRRVLVVEDNDDMRHFLRTLLSADYEVLTAADGKEALSLIEKEVPDLIVSDLMMPNMDGLELTKAIKTHPNYNYIPIILLTAKSAIESRLQALEQGADDYVTKPFEPEYLRARVKNILKMRTDLESAYRERLLRLEIPRSEEGLPNDTFLAKLLNVMEEQMDNNELTVDELVDAMHMGRTVFFNKLKGLTGLSPVEFIREMRIKRAAQLLEQGTYNIAEVTYMVGMNDSRYFSKCFKNTYGVTPTEYKRKMTASHEQK